MIALWGIVFGLVIGFARRGSLRHLARFELRHGYLIFLALAIQLLIFPTPWWPEPPLSRATSLFHLASYGLILLFLVLNRQHKPFWGVGAGMALNLTVIAANGGYMPTRLQALRRAGDEEIADKLLTSADGTYGNVVIMDEATKLNGLGDWLSIPPWLPLASSFSVGDVILMVSVAWLLQGLMATRNE